MSRTDFNSESTAQDFLNKDPMMLDHSVPRLVLNVAKAVCIVFNSWNISHRIKAHSEQMVPKSHVFKLYKCQKRCLILLLQGISKEDRKNLQAKQATKLLVCSVWNGLTKVILNNRLDIVLCLVHVILDMMKLSSNLESLFSFNFQLKKVATKFCILWHLQAVKVP